MNSVKQIVRLTCFSMLLISIFACAPRIERNLTLKYITNGNGATAFIQQNYDGTMTFKGVSETDTLREVFKRYAADYSGEIRTENAENDFGPWTWVASGYDPSTFGKFSSTLFDGEEAKTTYIWTGDGYRFRVKWGDKNVKENAIRSDQIRFIKNSPNGYYTIGLDEPLGDCSTIYVIYSVEKTGVADIPLFVLSWQNKFSHEAYYNANGGLDLILEKFTIDPDFEEFPSLLEVGERSEFFVLDGGSGNHKKVWKSSKDNIAERHYDLNSGGIAESGEATASHRFYNVIDRLKGNVKADSVSKFYEGSKEYGFVYYRPKDEPTSEHSLSASDGAWPVIRDGKKGLPITDSNTSGDDITDERDLNLYYLFNRHNERYYILSANKEQIETYSGADFADDLRDYSTFFSKLEKGEIAFNIECDSSGNPITYAPGDKIVAKDLKNKILIPAYGFSDASEENAIPGFPESVVTVNYVVSANNQNNGNGLKIREEESDSDAYVKGTGDNAIDGKCFPIARKIRVKIRVRTGRTLGDVRQAIVNSVTSKIREIESALVKDEDENGETVFIYKDDEGNEKIFDLKRKTEYGKTFWTLSESIWWPMDVDPLSYLIESKQNNKEENDSSSLEYLRAGMRTAMQIVSYKDDNNPDSKEAHEYYGIDDNDEYMPSKSDEFDKGIKKQSGEKIPKVYRTYDFARELLYGYRDYTEHGKRFYFDLKKQTMARGEEKSASTGGEWEVKLSAPGMASGWYVDSDNNNKEGYARPVTGDSYKILADTPIRPHYIEAGYAPIPRQMTNEVGIVNKVKKAVSSDNIDDMRRLDAFANFIYLPGNSSYRPSAILSVSEAQEKWGLLSNVSNVSVTEGKGVMNLSQALMLLPILPTERESTPVNIGAFEVMEIPMSIALLDTLLSQDGVSSSITNAIDIREHIKDYILKGVHYGAWDMHYGNLPQVMDYDTDFRNASLLPGAINPGSEDEGFFQSNFLSLYDVAAFLCNKMTEQYNTLTSSSLTLAYQLSGNKYSPVSGAKGFRLPTRDEFDYMARTVTQKQQFVPQSDSKTRPNDFGVDTSYDVEKRDIPSSCPSNIASYNEFSYSSGDVVIEEGIEAEAFIQSGLQRGLQNPKLLPGVGLMNYDKYDGDAEKAIQSKIGGDYRSIYDVTSFRYENGIMMNDYNPKSDNKEYYSDKGPGTYSETIYKNGQRLSETIADRIPAKTSLNVRAGSGVMDLTSAFFPIQPSFRSGINDTAQKVFDGLSSFFNSSGIYNGGNSDPMQGWRDNRSGGGVSYTKKKENTKDELPLMWGAPSWTFPYVWTYFRDAGFDGPRAGDDNLRNDEIYYDYNGYTYSTFALGSGFYKPDATSRANRGNYGLGRVELYDNADNLTDETDSTIKKNRLFTFRVVRSL